MSDYFASTEARESGGDPFAKNPRSTATGLYQFIDRTWTDLQEKHPELGLTADGRTDPAQSKRAMAAFTADNEAFLTNRGVEPNDTNIYLAHRFVAEGAMRALSADPTALVADIFPEVMKANPDLKGKRVADITGGSRPMMGYAAKPDEEVTPALSARAQLGPGVLDGTRDNQSWDWQNPLIGVGASLASITNPDQGRAIAATATRTAAAGDQFTTHVDPKTGRGIRLNTKTGQVTPFQAHAPVEEKSETQKAWDKGQAEGYVKLNEKIQTDAAASQASLANVGVLRNALSNPDVYQGAGGESLASLKKLGSTLGLDFKETADADVAQAVANRLTLESRALSGGMPGSLSDKDLVFLKDANVGLNKGAAANQRILDIYETLHNRNIERNALRGEYVSKNGMINEGFNTMLSQKWASENAARDKAAPDVAKPSAGAAPSKLPKGVTSIKLLQ